MKLKALVASAILALGLTGTAQAQYEGWRRLLKQIYQAETGFAETVDVGTPARMNSAE